MNIKSLHHLSSKLALYMQVVVLALPLMLGVIPRVGASQLENRAIQISTARLGESARHTFVFDMVSTGPLSSISFSYCTNSPMFSDPCVAPAGLDSTGASLNAQTTNTGFSYAAPYSSVNVVVISRPVAAGVSGASSYLFNNIINPTTPGETVFVRIATYATPDATGPATDRGSVAFATQDLFQVEAYVPPFLTFCIGVFVTLNCNSVTGNFIDIGELGKDRTATGLMQFSGATNDPTGYTTYLNGFTMTSGNNVINPLATNSGSTQGTSQFGLNLRSNSNPTFGLEPAGIGTSAPTPGYGTPNSYRFVDGEAITTSLLPTDFKIFTAAFIVNVAPSQPPGVYVATMTYTAIASF
jgi:hypothetical protein